MGDKVTEGNAYLNLGIIAYQMLGDLNTAIDYHERDLKVAKEVGDKGREGKAYGCLGIFHDRMGNFKTALDYHERRLKIAKEMKDKVEEGNAYGKLGLTLQSLGNLKTALDYHERHLKIAKEMRDKAGEGRAYGYLGLAFQRLGDLKTAIYYHERQLKIAKEVGDKFQEGAAYGDLGNAHKSRGDFQTAIDYTQRALKIAKEGGYKVLEVGSYTTLGSAHATLGDFQTAIDYYQRALKMAKEVGDKDGEGTTYGNLGNVYRNLGDFKTAIDYYQRCLKIAKNGGNKVGEGKSYGCLGDVYLRLGESETAIDYHQRSLEIAKEVGDKAEEGCAHGNLGKAYQSLGDLKTAADHYEVHLNIAKEVGENVMTAAAFYNVGEISELLGFIPKALECLYSSVKIFNIIRHDLKGKDELKISYRERHGFAYSSLWRLLLKQGKVAEALFTAEQARAHALNDLMELNYGLETTYSQLHTREESTYDSFRFLSSTAVFMAIDEREIVFWVVHDGNDVELRRKELSNNSSMDLKYFLTDLIVAASQEIGVRADIKCEDRSLDKLGDEQVVNRSPHTPAEPVSLGMSALRMLYDVVIEPIADLVHGDELILVPEGPLCLAPYAAFMDSCSTYLCDVCRIRVLPSFASLKMITESPDGYHSKMGVLLVGDPWVQEIVTPGKMLEQLPSAREEVQMIGRICETEPLI